MANIKYVSHDEMYELNLNGSEYFLSVTDFHQRATTVTASDSAYMPTIYSQEPMAIPATLVIKGTPDQRKRLMDRFVDVVQRDIDNGFFGRLWVDDFYADVKVIASSVPEPDSTNSRSRMSVTIYNSTGKWYREYTKLFKTQMAKGMDYPHDYPFDYAFIEPGADMVLDAPGYTDYDFKMVFEAPLNGNPYVSIGGHMYQLMNFSVPDEGSYVTIDSRDRTIMGYDSATMETESYFEYQNFDSYIFQKIHGTSGSTPHEVEISGISTVAITIYEERSEPRWT